MNFLVFANILQRNQIPFRNLHAFLLSLQCLESLRGPLYNVCIDLEPETLPYQCDRQTARLLRGAPREETHISHQTFGGATHTSPLARLTSYNQ